MVTSTKPCCKLAARNLVFCPQAGLYVQVFRGGRGDLHSSCHPSAQADTNSMACHCRYMQAPHLHSRLRHVLSARGGQGLEKGLRGLKNPDDLLLCPAGISVLATSAAGQGRQAAEVVPMYLQGPSLQAKSACWGCRTRRPGSWKCSREPTGQSDARPKLREGRRAARLALL